MNQQQWLRHHKRVFYGKGNEVWGYWPSAANSAATSTQRRRGDFDQRDFEADEWDSFIRLENWESMQSTDRSRWDELLAEMLEVNPAARVVVTYYDRSEPRMLYLESKWKLIEREAWSSIGVSK